MMSTAFATIAEITERQMTEAERQVNPDFMIACVDEINATIETRVGPKCTPVVQNPEVRSFGLKTAI